jgi:hypothetical protein
LRGSVSGQTELSPEKAVCLHESNRSRS